MKTAEFWIWWVHSETHHKRVRTSYRMIEADALATDPQAERVPGTLEVRQVPSTAAEHAHLVAKAGGPLEG